MNAIPTSRLACRKLGTFAPALWRRWLGLPPAMSDLPDELPDTVALLARLLDQDLLPEAARLLAHGLPEREAVWWSCMCVRHTLPEQPASAELAALNAAEAWVRQPDNDARLHAAQRATDAGREAPGAWSAFGAAWSHRVHGLPDICGGRGAAEAVGRAASRLHPDRTHRRLQSFIGAGIDIGNGGAGRLPAEATSCR